MFVHHRLRQRHQGGAEHALQDAEQHDLAQRLRHAAEDRGNGEADDGGDEQPRAAEPRGEEAGRRRHDRRRDDVAGQHPVDLFLAGRHRALHVGQRDIGDGAVERLHQRGHDGADRHQHPNACRPARLAPRWRSAPRPATSAAIAPTRRWTAHVRLFPAGPRGCGRSVPARGWRSRCRRRTGRQACRAAPRVRRPRPAR